MIVIRHVNSDYPSRAIVILLVPGILSLLFAILYEIPALAFVGLGLIFWGILFLLLGPPRRIESNLLCNDATSRYSTIDRIIKDFEYTGQAFYIPPYPKSVYIPEHLKSLKEAVVYISSEETSPLPSTEEIAQGKFLLENEKGILITPPGIGILTDIEDKSRIDFTNLNINQFCEIMPQIILEKFNLATEIEITFQQNKITMKIKDSIYKKLYEKESNPRGVLILGCPLVSAVACALTKSSNKIVKIAQPVMINQETIEVTYNLMQDWSQQINKSDLT
ncbi:MAG TPA: hypothetical protein VK209_13025 [Candidatus Sulfotelmatobacter sp.]|nr:hypothetical protein [Candidatus Sulfotelmatobacter sp.]